MATVMDRKTSFVVFLVHCYLSFATIICLFTYARGNPNVLCREREREALLNFKQGIINGSNQLSSWIGHECCVWKGIGCDNITGHVIHLNLRNPYDSGTAPEAFSQSQLGGVISDSLLELKHLRYLDLSENNFADSHIPSFFGYLGNLRYLSLSCAGFVGTIPHQLANLSNLHYLGIQGDLLHVDNLEWLSHLSLLKFLDMSFVNLSKASNWLQVMNLLPSLSQLLLSSCELDKYDPIPYVNFSSLSVLDLSFNYNLSSTILNLLCNISTLERLEFAYNNIQGVLPSAIGSLSQLISLDLSNNGLEGKLPRSLGNLCNLQNLDLSHNKLGGGVYELLGNSSLSQLIYLDLSNNGLEGKLPRSLGNLCNLQHLDFSHNKLGGGVYELLGNSSLSQLIYLNLSNNGLEGKLPRSLGNLCNLQHLDLSHNKHGGGVYELLGNSSLSQLTYLDLSNNGLEGKLTRSLGNLCNLQHLDLSHNKLGGGMYELLGNSSACTVKNMEFLDLSWNRLLDTFPNQLGKNKKLSLLFLDSNMLSGPIPVSIENLSSLRILSVSHNKLNGTIPVSLGHLSNLEELYISDNFLESFVSDVHFSNLTNLKILEASSNLLTLQVSFNWVPPFQLQILEMESWTLGSRFPAWLQSQKDLQVLNLSNTSISGVIPSWFWSLCSQFLVLDLSHNQIRGSIPSLSCGGSIFLGSNKFFGPLPHISSSIKGLDLSNNSFRGSLSPFVCEQNDIMRDLLFLDLSKNLLSGEVPDCWMNYSQLMVLNLGSNNLTGNIPSSLGSLFMLEFLTLNKNNLFGHLPLSLQKCTLLKIVDLRENHLSGSLSIWPGNSAADLRVLVLRSNKFYGSIPHEFCHLKSLQIMDLAQNKFTGPIPRCFGNLSAMVGQNLDIINKGNFSLKEAVYGKPVLLVIKGTEYEYRDILALVTSMDLSRNNLIGEIPDELTSLSGLRFLNLSNNQLHGKIPEKINAMISLESLDVSMNQLTGAIPQSMASLTCLNHLNLSYNNFSGRIPSSTQLQSFSAFCFIGNDHDLCGPPLTSSCVGDGPSLETTPNADDEGREDSGWIDLKWFYMSMPFGFVVGFWGVFGPLAFNRAWRWAFFKFLDDMKNKFFNGV
jgi:Leucine-rich repeat (LRR) protein